jgi:8-oxo-dGTP pyrophosphatase MutT (NUDIX family)
MLKIFVNNKPLFLVDAIDRNVDEYLHRPDTIFIDELNPSAIKTMLQQLENEDYYAGVFLHPSIEELLNAFKSQLVLVQAAGGLVHTKAKELLLIFRKGKWDLPKGKLDEGEDLMACALREITEETGAHSLSIEKPLQLTYHTYYEKEKHILKESHWYLVKTTARSVLKPQMEEDIEKCEWVPINYLEAYTSNMHASIIDVINNSVKILTKK